MPKKKNIGQVSVESEAVTAELAEILSRNLALRLLLAGGYRWAAWAVVLAIAYFVLGAIIASANYSLVPFLQTRPLYVVLLAIVASVTAACWYPQVLLQVLAAIPKSFRVDPETERKLVGRWMQFISLPRLFTGGIALAVIGVTLSLRTEAMEWSLSSPYTPWNWWTIHYQIPNAISGVILGAAVQVFLATLFLFRQLFRFEMRLFQYRHLSSLSTFSAGLTIASLVAVALYILLVFDKLDSGAVFTAVLGILGAVLMFTIPQFSYQLAVSRAKRKYLICLGNWYERHFAVVEQDDIDPKSLQTAKDAIEGLEALERNINAVPNWLINLSDAMRVLVSLLAPLGSLIVNALLSSLRS